MKAVSERRAFIALNLLSMSSFLPRVTLRCLISAIVNTLPQIGKQSNTQKVPRSRFVADLPLYFVQESPLELNSEMALAEIW